MQMLSLGQWNGSDLTDPPVPSGWKGPKINRHTPTPPTELSTRKAEAAYKLLAAHHDQDKDRRYEDTLAGRNPTLYYQALYDVSRSPIWAISYTEKTNKDWEPPASKKKRGDTKFGQGGLPGHELTEQRIGRNASASIAYASWVLRRNPSMSGRHPRRRFLPGEEAIIAAGPEPLLQYIKYLSRVNDHPGVDLVTWPEVEAILAQDPKIWKEYKAGIGNPRLPVPTAPYVRPHAAPDEWGMGFSIWWIVAAGAVGYWWWTSRDV